MSRLFLRFLIGFSLLACLSCARSGSEHAIIPAEEFSKAMREGKGRDYSFIRARENQVAASTADNSANGMPPAASPDARGQFSGDPRYLKSGLTLRNSIDIPSPQIPVSQIASTEGAASFKTAKFGEQPPSPPLNPYPAPPPGSSAPYFQGQMTANPSLWPDEAQGAYLFSDYRAFQPMDVITIVINENTKGNKKAETDANSDFSLSASIANFLGLETKDWAANNPYLDPSALVEATTNSKFKGKGETKRTGSLTTKLSAVIMEVFPNGLMRIEGTKIVSLDSEEEVVVISGLVRARDISSQNLVDSSRVANMRIDFYGQGLLSEHNRPGWGSRLFEIVWPF